MCYGVDFACRDNDVVFCVLSENTLRVDSKSISPRFHHGDGNIASARVDITPVLIRRDVLYVILVVDAVLGEDSDGADNVVWEIDVAFPGCAASGGDVVGDVFSNRVVEGRVPGWGVVLEGVVAEVEEGGGGGAAVEVEVLLRRLESYIYKG